MHFEDIINNFEYLTKGLVITLELALISLLGSMLLGLFLGIVRHMNMPVLSWIATGYIEFIRSIPLVLFMFFVHYGFLPYILHIKPTVFFSVFIALVVFTAAYVAEIVRGGLRSIERGHIEAARSVGLTYFQTMGYVVLPLALSRMTPALVSQFIALIKDTSLASTIGLIELTGAGQIVYGRTLHTFEILIFIAIIYFIICYTLSIVSKRLESLSSTKLTENAPAYN